MTFQYNSPIANLIKQITWIHQLVHRIQQSSNKLEIFYLNTTFSEIISRLRSLLAKQIKKFQEPMLYKTGDKKLRKIKTGISD